MSDGMIDGPDGRVWYRTWGDGARVPLLLLHGGPGWSSDYLHNMSTLSDERRVIVYDQLGAGRSERPDRAPTVDQFVAEVIELRRALGLDEVHLFGNSWGTALAILHELGGASGIRSLVLQGPYLSTSIAEADNARRLDAMPRTARVLRQHILDDCTGCPEYTAALHDFYKAHLCRLESWPDDLHRLFKGLNPDVVHALWGPDDFICTGSLAGFDLTADATRIKTPTLLVCGELDQVMPDTAAYFQQVIPRSELVMLPGAAHLANLDQPAELTETVRSFIRRYD